ncbi:MAG: transcriptional repressor [Deltaproteobacteria bacterium]|nr:transcriptional repressor [Deltaproteobacteria bacterium]
MPETDQPMPTTPPGSDGGAPHHHAPMSLHVWLEKVDEAIVRDRQRPTRQRRMIAHILYDHRHLNVEELHQQVRACDESVGYATVYRTVKLLERVGLVNVGHFGDGTARYEVAVGDEDHHDHLICTRCNRIVEFENEAIEATQRQIAAAHGFVLTGHRMDLFGVCPACQQKKGR